MVGYEPTSFSSEWDANAFYLFLAQAVASGNVKTINVYKRTTGNSRIKVALYSDSSGNPNTRLTYSGETNIVQGWNSISVPPAAVVSGTWYWLAFDADTACVGQRDGTGITRLKKSWTYSTFTPPDPAGSGFGKWESGTLTVGLAAYGSSGCPRQAMHMRRLM